MSRLIDLGKLRFHFRGEWAEGVQYEINDLVSYGACLYLYKFPLKEAGNPPTSNEHWALLVKGMRHRGGLEPGVNYLLGDVVSDGASSRVALANFTSSGSFGEDTSAKWGVIAFSDSSIPDPIDQPSGLMLVTGGGEYKLQAPRAPRDLVRHVKSGEVATAFDGSEFTTDTRKGVAEVVLPQNPQGGEKVKIYDTAGSWSFAPILLRGNGKQIDGNKSDYALDEAGATVVITYIDHDLQWRIQ